MTNGANKAPHQQIEGPQILDGRVAAEAQLKKIQSEVNALIARKQRVPGLMVIQVGENPASNAYIRQKQKSAETCGFFYVHKKLPRTASKSEILNEIAAAANNSQIDGMILQLPLDTSHAFAPVEVDEIVESIPPSKDADGLHSFNQGKLFTGDSLPDKWKYPIPATPLGVYRLLQHYSISPKGKDVAVVGRSRLVGLPISVIMIHEGATVTVCHSKTRDLKATLRNADIVIVAAGKKHLIGPEHLKGGAVVVDVGIHAKEDGKLTGDVSPDAYKKLAAYSPVPGGVGPMTVASLMENTLKLRQSAK